MTRFDELVEIFCEDNYRTRYIAAKTSNICIRCGEPAEEFSDASARLEYRVSALCQICQDHFFDGE